MGKALAFKAFPEDLRKKSLMLAGYLLEMTGKYTDGAKTAREILESGKALKKMVR